MGTGFFFSFHYLYDVVRVAYFNHSSKARIVFTVSQKQIFFFFKISTGHKEPAPEQSSASQTCKLQNIFQYL